MTRLIPIMSLFCIFCNNTNDSINYIERNLDYDSSGELTRQSEVLFSKADNEKKWHIVTIDSKGLHVHNSRLVRDGRTEVRYNEGELASITTKDDQTNCEVKRSFPRKTIYEKTTCNGRDVRVISIEKDVVYEKNCATNNGLEVCHSKYQGDQHTEYYYELGQSRIHSYQLLPEDETQIFAMWSTIEIPNGQRVEQYHMELPVGSAFPTANDTRWQLEGTSNRTGYIPSIQKYTLVVNSGRNGTSKHTLETY